MNFRPGTRDEPEINLIPFIDILLVVLIFLMLTTTYSKFTQLQVNLPVADAQAQREQPKEIIVSISADGRYAVNKDLEDGASVDVLTRALTQLAQDSQDTIIIISADAAATHQFQPIRGTPHPKPSSRQPYCPPTHFTCTPP